MVNTVNVQARDKLGNNVSTGGEVFLLSLDNSYTKTQMIDNNDGTYSATYTASTAGTINVKVYKRESSGLVA